MRYLTLSVGYNSFLRDDFDGEFDCLNLSDELVGELEVWYEEYLPVIQLDQSARMAMHEEIRRLDDRGIELGREIQKQLNDVKVRYYSEGWLKFIDN